MSAAPPDDIKIVDVIHHYHDRIQKAQVLVVVDRMPMFVFERDGDQLTATDCGFYSFMQIYRDPVRKAFAGRQFDLQLKDGTTLHCNGQVWAGLGRGQEPEPLMFVGLATIKELEACYVFSSGYLSIAKYNDWMARNEPSFDYWKYDYRETVEYLDSLRAQYPDWDRRISRKRARTLRRRGVTIRYHPQTGQPGWSQDYERRKAEILFRKSPVFRGKYQPKEGTDG